MGNSEVLDPVVPFSWFLRSNTIHVALLFQEANHFEQNFFEVIHKYVLKCNDVSIKNTSG